MAVQQVYQLPRRTPIGKRSEPSHVREPDRRMNFLDIAPPDLSGKNALSGAMPNIGVEQIARRSPQRIDFADPGQRGDDALDPGDLVIRETARPPRRPRPPMNRAPGH